MKKIIDKIDKFITKCLVNEKGKWDSGMKNSYYLTKDLTDDIQEILNKWRAKL